MTYDLNWSHYPCSEVMSATILIACKPGKWKQESESVSIHKHQVKLTC